MRDSNPHNSIGGRLGKQMCYPLHHVSPLFTQCGLVQEIMSRPYKVFVNFYVFHVIMLFA